MQHNNDISYSPREKRLKNKEEKFLQKNITFDDTPLFFPEGFEKLFLLLYFITLPYIAGILFLFFYIANGKKELFLSLNDDASFIMTWAIGYEIIAAIVLLWIIKSAISFSYGTHQQNKKKVFRRP